MNTKVTFARELRAWDNLALGEFCTWPGALRVQSQNPRSRRRTGEDQAGWIFSLRLPDAQQFFFLEVDRGTETLDTVVRICFGYHEFFRTGGMARRFRKSDPKDAPFRVIVSVESQAPRNNMAEALLRMRNPCCVSSGSTRGCRLKPIPLRRSI